jgi:hypothetical protein
MYDQIANQVQQSDTGLLAQLAPCGLRPLLLLRQLLPLPQHTHVAGRGSTAVLWSPSWCSVLPESSFSALHIMYTACSVRIAGPGIGFCRHFRPPPRRWSRSDKRAKRQCIGVSRDGPCVGAMARDGQGKRHLGQAATLRSRSRPKISVLNGSAGGVGGGVWCVVFSLWLWLYPAMQPLHLRYRRAATKSKKTPAKHLQ